MVRAYPGASSAVIAVVAAIALSGLACESDERACYPGDFVACDCEDGQPGYSQCDPEGAAYGVCEFCGATPGLAAATSTGSTTATGSTNPTSSTTSTAGSGGGATTATSGSGGAGGAGGGAPVLLPFLSPCETNEQCETNLCYPFNAKGPHCTLPCDGPEDCPSPSPGCNLMGVCKVP